LTKNNSVRLSLLFILKTGAKICLYILFLFVLVELTMFFFTRFKDLPFGYPPYSFKINNESFVQDINKDFGVWHKPNITFHHQRSCFNVTYYTNSYGARDPERTKQSKNNQPRVVVLGDSFVEGFGVERNRRLSTLLESKTGVEHLNFGTAGNFGTTQQAILYETLAMQFDHTHVIIGMLPDNDFSDDSLTLGKKGFSDRYRPYYVGTYPNYKIIYFKDTLNESTPNSRIGDPIKIIKSYLRSFTFSYNLLSYIKRVMPYLEENSKLYSGYFDFSEEEFLKARFSIEKIVRLANDSGKKVLLFTIPTYSDFLRAKDSASTPLNSRLSKLSKSIGFEYVDLLPNMKLNTPAYEDYFLPCDGHWNPYGNKIATDILLNESLFYSKDLKPPTF